jgi:hypothetical protein
VDVDSLEAVLVEAGVLPESFSLPFPVSSPLL